MAELLPGAPVAERLTQDLKARSDVLRQRGVTPTLAIIRVGRDPGGLAYEKGAASRCAKCGIDLRRIPLEDARRADEIFTVLMGEQVEPRKDWIERNARYAVNIDI